MVCHPSFQCLTANPYLNPSLASTTRLGPYLYPHMHTPFQRPSPIPTSNPTATPISNVHLQHTFFNTHLQRPLSFISPTHRSPLTRCLVEATTALLSGLTMHVALDPEDFASLPSMLLSQFDEVITVADAMDKIILSAQASYESDRRFLLRRIDRFPDCRFTMRSLLKECLHDWLLWQVLGLFEHAAQGGDGVRSYSALDTASLASRAGWLLMKRGRGSEEGSADAETLHRRALDQREELLGPLHPHTLASLENLIFSLESQDEKGEEAELLQVACRGVNFSSVPVVTRGHRHEPISTNCHPLSP